MLDQQISATRQAVKDHIDGHSTLKGQRDLLVLIPANGVGHIADATAAALLAELLDVRQFDGPRQVAAFAGLAPRIRQSDSCGAALAWPNRATGAGGALYFREMVVLRFNPFVKALGEWISSVGKSKLATLGTAMRKIL